ncbi:Rha family transcriptional regulator [Psychrobacillus lasiicapitis]|uniref:Rha family transcriptional regulator n=1 Tax=Psychrobacillus lasiicapitis TaxID=1636719 RepID=A0A544TA93_9BACI|nr:Rha family transcriptional regulator [Psychrobacillus lasiicapitis]TQR14359.1 Rha family transcriptional regulator [Psychrobacillus lasiicapitis]GGA32025.1 hypothetical protein GCM10011384_22000 [Psychrobacillus lasiicapitis]
MNQLVIMHDQQAVTTSLQVAEDFGKRHDNVLRDIEGLKEDVLNFEEMFFQTETPDAYGRPRKTYFMNRDGFTLLAMGFNGKEAILFKLKYIEAFNQMEKQLTQPLSPLEIMQMQIKQLVEQEKRMNEQDNRIEKIETEQQNITEIIGLSIVEWRKKVTNVLNRIAKNNGGYQMYQEIRNESYKMLEERAKCKLNIRVTNKQKVMALNGVPKSTVNKVSKLDAISEDARLTEIYLAIVKELAIKYRVSITDLEV